MFNLLKKSPLALFLLLFVVRMTTTLPVLNALTAAGVSAPVAKTISQIPTVLLVLGLVAGFRWWREVGLTRTGRWQLADVAVLALPSLLVLGVPLFGGAYHLADLTSIPVLLFEALLVAVWEEVYFRGILLNQVEIRYPRYAVLIAAVAFGLAHAGNGMLGASPAFVVAQTLWTFLYAFGVTAARRRMGSLWPLIASHFVLDGLERVVADGQAVGAPIGFLILMVGVSGAMAVYGYLALRNGGSR